MGALQHIMSANSGVGLPLRPESLVTPASLLQSVLDHVQLLCSHVGNNSRVKLLFCLIFLANLHIQAIFFVCYPYLLFPFVKALFSLSPQA